MPSTKVRPISLHDLMVLYHDEGVSLGLSEGTLNLRRRMLRRFYESCQVEHTNRHRSSDVMMRHLDPLYLSRFFGLIQGTGQSNRNNALWAVAGLIKYAERLGYLPSGDADWLLGQRKIKRATRQPKYYIPADQFGPMMVAAGERHPCERALMACAFYTLGRQGEIAGLRLKHLDLSGGVVRMWRNKRKRYTDITICPDFMDELGIWLPQYAEEMGYSDFRVMMAEHPEWYLVPRVIAHRQANSRGKYDSKLTTFSINPTLKAVLLERLLKRMLDIFGAKTENGKSVRHKGEGMHTIRRSGARAMVDNLALTHGEQMAVDMVSIFLDHDDPKQTLLYIGRDLTRQRVNSLLQTSSPFGEHGRQAVPGNVVRMPLRGAVRHGDELPDDGRVDVAGSVDAL